MKRYLVMAMRKPAFQQSVVEKHREFLGQLKADGKLEMAGPFGDKSGGAYLLNADSLAEAESLAYSDPVHASNSSDVTVYEWHAK